MGTVPFRRPEGRCAVPGTPRLALHRLGLDELLEAVLAALAPDARLLVAAEGRARVEVPAVDVDLARAHLAGYPLGPGRVGAPHRAGQSVRGAVGDLDGLFLGVVGDDGEDGTEDLLLGDGHVRRDP